MQLSGLHVCFEVEDFGRSMAFWGPLCEVAGFKPAWGDGKVYAGFRNGSIVVSIGAMQPRRITRAAPTGQEFVVAEHVGFHATRREDVDAVAAHMAAAGFQPLFPAQEYPEFGPGFYAVTFCDPDNNVIEFAWRPPTPG